VAVPPLVGEEAAETEARRAGIFQGAQEGPGPPAVGGVRQRSLLLAGASHRLLAFAGVRHRCREGVDFLQLRRCARLGDGEPGEEGNTQVFKRGWGAGTISSAVACFDVIRQSGIRTARSQSNRDPRQMDLAAQWPISAHEQQHHHLIATAVF